MVRRKLAAVAAVLALGATALSGCTSDGAGASGASSPADSQLSKVLDSGVLRVAVLQDFPPWAVQKPDGTFEGYEIDIAQDLADSLGAKLKLVSTDGDSRLPLLKSNR